MWSLRPVTAVSVAGCRAWMKDAIVRALLVAAVSLLRPGHELETADQPSTPQDPPHDGQR